MPLLRTVPTATNTVVVVGSVPLSGFKLQFNTDLSATNWTDSGQVRTVVGGEKPGDCCTGRRESILPAEMAVVKS
jgi:hypothetical protein